MASNFEGRRIDASIIKVTGDAGLPNLNPKLALEEERYVLARVAVAKVQHHDDEKLGLVRTHTARIETAWLVEDNDYGLRELLEHLRGERKRALDEAAGTPGLFTGDNEGEL